MKALVTGANGHLGVHLVRQLLAAGHTVRAGLRSVNDPARRARVAPLGAVECVQADLDRPDGLTEATDGVDVLFHTAAVYSICDPSRNAELHRASTAGLEAMLRAAARTGVRKVVLTSSAVTVPVTRPGATPSTEADWNDDLRVPYVRAKTEGERRAWTLASELGLNLVTILPGAFGGPGFERNTPTIDVLEAMMRGAFRAGVPPANLPYVDVRDVARAHLLAAERDAQGRFLAVNDEQPSFAKLIEVMHGIDPRIKRPLATLPGFMMGAAPFFDQLNARTLGTPRTVTPEMIAMTRGKRFNASNRRARELLHWRPAVPLEQSISDTLEALCERVATEAAAYA